MLLLIQIYVQILVKTTGVDKYPAEKISGKKNGRSIEDARHAHIKVPLDGIVQCEGYMKARYQPYSSFRLPSELDIGSYYEA